MPLGFLKNRIRFSLLLVICGPFESMRYISVIILIFICASSAFGEEEMECPNRQTDPSKFCLPGQAWNEEMQKCVNLV